MASIAISERPGDLAFLNFVLVLPEYRGRGVGYAMMRMALEYARTHSLKEVQLETYSCLVAARALYSRLGFRTSKVAPDKKAFGQTFQQEFWTLTL
ncbi:GNAT family N-acetyltransferase [Cupriavidus sp. H39]|uniref:GNAT family N-acetyltransferase n=1 Tax=Cupriavidus sp. H39 TaxID=3401635 RepID=UPI003CFDE739